MYQKNNKVFNVSDEEFKRVINRNNSLSKVLADLGYSSYNTNAVNNIKIRMKELNLTIDRSSLYGKIKIPDEDIFKKGAFVSNDTLRRRVLRSNFIIYECSLCRLPPEWEGKELVLQLDHIDGDVTNNEKKNLRWLCPNCHTQTDTYANSGKRTKGSERPLRYKSKGVCKKCNNSFTKKSKSQKFCSAKCSNLSRRKELPISKEELYVLLINHSFLKVGDMYNVSDNAIRKWCRRYGIPSNSSYYKEIKNKN